MFESRYENKGFVNFIFKPISRPIALAIRVLVGFKREYRRAGISYPSVAATVAHAEKHLNFIAFSTTMISRCQKPQ